MKIIFYFIIAYLLPLSIIAQEGKKIPFWDTSLSFELRAKDIVSRLTLEEKARQMINHAPAIERYSIPAYDWWNEVLHGVARTPYPTTSYPQAIAMASTWDTTSLQLMAKYSAYEGRAIHKKAIEVGKNGDRYMGLTYWTPNINIFRDPRWGRGQETYGEDPYLTSKLGASFVRGLQGSDEKYLLAAACAKHYAVHSGPEPSRHSDNFTPSNYDLWDTYLPAFQELITKAKVEGVMCAYNAIHTQPCCSSDLLMNDILRNKWKFKGYVTSDCWALDDFFTYHKTHADKTEAAIDAVIHGTDLECGNDVYLSLIDAVHEGRIKEDVVDASVIKLFMTRLKLGMFDPISEVPYAQSQFSILEAPEHKAHALRMAQQSIVLLKNENRTLPLSKNIEKIVVFGPNGDNSISILGNYNGKPTDPITVVDGLQRKLGAKTQVIYERAINYTNDTLMVHHDISELWSYYGKKGIHVAYFNNEDLTGAPAHTSIVKEINSYWLEGQSPAENVSAFHFSARFTAMFTNKVTETVHFQIEGDDGYRLFINDSLYVDAWTRNRWGPKQISVPTIANKEYKIVVEYRQSEGVGIIKLLGGNYIKTDMDVLIRKHGDADAFIFAGGISPQLEGEEMKVNYLGFDGGDRTTIQLPVVQSLFLDKLKDSGKPVIFVMMTGSAIAIPKEDKTIPAILNAWYGGQSAGEAIADVIFGDYNPAGRLPVTFYIGDKDLPSFKDYSMANRTYRYFKGEVLYPFGHGLSFTSFNYYHFNAPKEIRKGEAVVVEATVKNTGDRDGEEVVQCYITHKGKFPKVPLTSLKGFQRIFLKSGESKKVQFTLSTNDLSVVGEDGNLYQIGEKIEVSIGGKQPRSTKKTTSNSISTVIKVQ